MLWGMVLGVVCAATAVRAQDAPQPQPQGDVLFQSHGTPPEPDADRTPLGVEDNFHGPDVLDSERAAVEIEAYDLDAHMTPATGGLVMHARVTLRNRGASAMTRVPLQISSSLRWESAAVAGRTGQETLAVAQHTVETDLDHTGVAREAVLVLPRPLAPDGALTLDLYYSGMIAASGERLARIGADATQAAKTDWDAIAPEGIALRGFGDVLWYPVAAPPVFLGEGAKLFDAVGKARLAGETTRARLTLAILFAGRPPVAVFFCGRRAELSVASDDPGTGVASAEFADAPVGFRGLNLFSIAQPEALLPADSDAVEASSSSAENAAAGPILAVETEANEAVLPRLSAAAESAAVVPEAFLGTKPLQPLTVLDHAGEPFEDGALLLAPVESLASSDATEALVHSLTHAWIETGQPWMDEGLAEFMELAWKERTEGREAAVGAMRVMLEPLALAEPQTAAESDAADGTISPGQPLIAATGEMFYRRKAAAVWWMLRDLVGEQAFAKALATLRARPASTASAEEQAREFELSLESEAHADLRWFFDDWVLNDKGLPDLAIADVTPRALPAGKGHDSGWLVAVTVHNSGGATADVPLVVRSGTFSTTRRMRVPANASATERVLIEAPPSEVVVNDGSVPEQRTSVHSRVVHVDAAR